MPWLEVNDIVNMTFETPFEFSVDIKWISEDTVMDSKLLSKTV